MPASHRLLLAVALALPVSLAGCEGDHVRELEAQTKQLEAINDDLRQVNDALRAELARLRSEIPPARRAQVTVQSLAEKPETRPAASGR